MLQSFPGPAKRRKRRTEPDLDVIKQVEQGSNVGFRSTGPGVLPNSEHGDHGAVVILVFPNLSIINLADFSLQKTAKNSW